MRNLLPVFLLALMSKFTYAQPPAAGNLVAYWTMDRDWQGVVKDSSANKFQGTAYELTYEILPTGKAALFNSAKDEIHIPGKGMRPPARIASLTTGSISVWFKYQSLPDGQVLPILYFGESDTASAHNSLIIEIGHSHNLANRRIYFTIVNQRFCFDSRVNLEENRWYHFVAVVSEKGNTGYLDGIPMYRRNYNLGSDSTYTDFFASVDSAEILSIGYGRYGQESPFFHFKGSIDEVAIFDRALDPAEVLELYQYGRQKLFGTEPGIPDVSYGPYERNVLDFWQAESDEPTPVVVFIHGGGFVNGSKESIQTAAGMQYIQQCLEKGVSFASISYRYATTTRLDTVLFDCARAIQFLRSKSGDWNIDPGRFAAYGGSAGGAASLYLAVHDDLADPDNMDPVLRESTRLTAAGHLNSQSTMDCDRWADIMGVADSWVRDMNFNDYKNFYKVDSWEEIYSEEVSELRRNLDMILMMDEKDPPLFLDNPKPDTVPLTAGEVIHHPRHIKYLKKKCDSLGIETAIILEDTPLEERVGLMDFFFKYFFPDTLTGAVQETTGGDLLVFPNPSGGLFRIQSGSFIEIITIYDILGNKLCTLYPRSLNLTVDLGNYPPGLYFLRTGSGSCLQLYRQ